MKNNILSTQKFISFFALFASFFALCVIALGAFTRLIDAGLGCPDWPGCYGHLTVSGIDMNSIIDSSNHFVAYKAWAEMIHRYFVGGLSFFIVTIVILIMVDAFASKSHSPKRSNIAFGLFLILLLIYQIMLGRWTVTLKLLPIIVSQHLLGGFLILSTLWLLFLNNQTRPRSTMKSKSFLPWAIVGILILFLQIMLGAWTSTNYASLSCPDFPFCINDQSILPLQLRDAFNFHAVSGVNYEGGVLSQSARQTIQMLHRFGALIFTLYMLIFTFFAMPKLKNHLEFVKPLYVVLGLLCAQLCIGISNVIFKLPIATAILHNIVAALLLLALITFAYKLANSSEVTA